MDFQETYIYLKRFKQYFEQYKKREIDFELAIENMASSMSMDIKGDFKKHVVICK